MWFFQLDVKMMSRKKLQPIEEKVREELDEAGGNCKLKLLLLDRLTDLIDLSLKKLLEDGEITDDPKEKEEMRDHLLSQLLFIDSWKEEILYMYDFQRNMYLEKESSEIYHLKLSLKGTKPSIWRTLEVPGCIRFEDLHEIIQEIFEWTDSHLHMFEAIDDHGNRQLIRPPNEDIDHLEEDEYQDERYEFLFEYLTSRTRHLTYVYDFGDNWEVGVELKDIVKLDPEKDYPVLLKGRRASPPEDCGGPSRFQELLKVIKNKDHPEYNETMEWLGGDFDPDLFDPGDYTLDDLLLQKVPTTL